MPMACVLDRDAAGLQEHRGVDPDHVLVLVEQRPPGVAGVDRGVGLDDVVEVGRLRGGRAQARLGDGDDAGRRREVARVGTVGGIADGDDRLALAHVALAVEGERPQAVAIGLGELEQRDVLARRGADELGVELGAVEVDAEALAAVDDVEVRHDEAVVRVEDPATAAGAPVGRAGRDPHRAGARRLDDRLDVGGGGLAAGRAQQREGGDGHREGERDDGERGGAPRPETTSIHTLAGVSRRRPRQTRRARGRCSSVVLGRLAVGATGLEIRQRCLIY
jgi:hypothetical protein